MAIEWTPTKCARCDVVYPEEILSPVHGSLVSGPVCGICALDIINAIHGTRRTSLRGTGEQYRLAAIEHRQKTRQVAAGAAPEEPAP